MSSIKRLNRDLVDWHEYKSQFPNFSLDALEDNMHVWHMNIFLDKVDAPLHGVIKFPKDYPFEPPRVFFLKKVPHDQILGKRNKLCLDMLAKCDGHYSGWSSAYSVVALISQMSSIVSQINDSMENDNDDWNNTIESWRRCKCTVCGHDGEDVTSFVPAPFSRVECACTDPETDTELWSLLYEDVEHLIFSFLSATDLNRMARMNRHIEGVLSRMKVYQWTRLQCYHSHETFRDFCEAYGEGQDGEEIRRHVFGIGFVAEYWENEVREGNSMRTKKVLKNLNLSLDVLTHESFSNGVKFSMWMDFTFDHFLPLYVNETHGAYALEMCEKVISDVYKCENASSEFDCVLALRFLSKLMNTTVVHLMTEIEDGENSVSLFTSTKAIQGYMFVYHLLLGFSKKYAGIIEWAKEKVSDFMDEKKRNKKNYPDLGEFLVCLTLVDVPWAGIGPLIAEELETRGAKWLLQKYPSLVATDKNTQISCIRLRQTWQSQLIAHRLLMFQVYFLHNVCNFAKESDLDSVLSSYNRTLGVACDGMARDLQVQCRRIFCVDDWLQYYELIDLPCPSARRLSHDCRLAIVASDRKGYHRFVETAVADRRHEQSGLCICSGEIVDIVTGNAVDVGDDVEDCDEEFDSTRQNLDVAFSIDCTGSMNSFLASVKENIVSIAHKLSKENSMNVRFAIVGYRDHNERGSWPKETKVTRFCSVKKFEKALSGYHVGGGGGFECVACAWRDVMNLNWTRFGVKVVIHMADIACHGLTDGLSCHSGNDPIVFARNMASQNMTLYNVGVILRNVESELFYEGTAHMTGGLFLPIDDAQDLPRLIVESALEGVSLGAVVPRVKELLEVYRERNPHASRDQLAYLIHEELKGEDISTKKVQFAVANLPQSCLELSDCHRLDDCLEIVGRVTDESADLSTDFKKQLKKGFKIFAKDGRHGFFGGTILAVGEGKVEVHFEGYPSRYDKWIDVNSDNIRKRVIRRHEVVKTVSENERVEITLDQTIRCVKRAEQVVEKEKHEERGCVYRTPPYSKASADERFAQAEMKMDSQLLRLPAFCGKQYDEVTVLDTKTEKWLDGTVMKIDFGKYKVVIRAELKNGRTKTVECALNSLRLKKAAGNKRNLSRFPCGGSRTVSHTIGTRRSTVGVPQRSVRPTNASAVTRTTKDSDKTTSSRSRSHEASNWRSTNGQRTRSNRAQARRVPQRQEKRKKGGVTKSMKIKWNEGSKQQLSEECTGETQVTCEKVKKSTVAKHESQGQEAEDARSESASVTEELKMAVHGGDAKKLKKLLKNLGRAGAFEECSREFENEQTLLHVAALMGDAQMVEILLDFGADPAAQDITGRTALDVVEEEIGEREWWNAERDIFCRVGEVLEKAMSKRDRNEVPRTNRSQNGVSAVVAIVSLTNLPINFGERDLRRFVAEFGLIPVRSAAWLSMQEMESSVKAVVFLENDHKLVHTLVSLEGYEMNGNALGIEMEFIPREQVERRALECLREVNGRRQDECVGALFAAHTGDIEAVRRFLGRRNGRGMVETCDENGRTMLHFAAVAGHVEVVKLLLENGANPVSADKNGVTPRDAIRGRRDSAARAIESVLIGASREVEKVVGKGSRKVKKSREKVTAADCTASLFCTGFPEVRELSAKLRKKFSAFGSLKEMPFVTRDRGGRLIAFVTFNRVSDAKRAKSALDGDDDFGTRMVVEYRRPRRRMQ